MTTSMYCLYVGLDYTYIDINALGPKSLSPRTPRETTTTGKCVRQNKFSLHCYIYILFILGTVVQADECLDSK